MDEDWRFQIPMSPRSGVIGLYGDTVMTLTQLPGTQPVVMTVPSMSTQVIVGSWRFGMSPFWVAMTAFVSLLRPDGFVKSPPGWTLVTRAISRAAWATPLYW